MLRRIISIFSKRSSISLKLLRKNFEEKYEQQITELSINNDVKKVKIRYYKKRYQCHNKMRDFTFFFHDFYLKMNTSDKLETHNTIKYYKPQVYTKKL